MILKNSKNDHTPKNRREKPEFIDNPCDEVVPSISEAKALLKEAAGCNPGPWEKHSENVALAAKMIAQECHDLNPDKAYVLGLLHDIGRRFGVTFLAHVYDGYHYLLEKGYEDAARIALTHSFNLCKIEDYIGKFDISEEKQDELRSLLGSVRLDDYDYLIQLCDALALPDGIVHLEQRMNDVKSRYGYYPQEKWDRNFYLKEYFETKMGKGLYDVLESDYSAFTIETQNLILRKASESDLYEIYNNLWCHEESARYMLWDVTKSIEVAKERLRKSIVFQQHKKYAFFVCEKISGKAIGFAGMKEIAPGVFEDTGIAVGPEYVGKGYGTEILSAFIEEARKCGARKFVASCRKHNLASHNLMMKCGLSFSHDEDRTDPRDGSHYVLEFNEVTLI